MCLAGGTACFRRRTRCWHSWRAGQAATPSRSTWLGHAAAASRCRTAAGPPGTLPAPPASTCGASTRCTLLGPLRLNHACPSLKRWYVQSVPAALPRVAEVHANGWPLRRYSDSRACAWTLPADSRVCSQSVLPVVCRIQSQVQSIACFSIWWSLGWARQPAIGANCGVHAAFPHM